MQWNNDRDVMMMREVTALGVLVHKSGSKERGQLWQQVADSLNENEEIYVTARGVRDRLMTIMKKHRIHMNKEKKLSGEGGEEVTEFDVLVEGLIEISDDTDARSEEKSKDKKIASEEDRKKAVDIRNTAMERFGETRRRKCDDDDEPPKHSRRSSSDTLTFLREKMESDKENKRIEREERARERADAQQQQSNMQLQFNALLAQQTEILKMLVEKRS